MQLIKIFFLFSWFKRFKQLVSLASYIFIRLVVQLNGTLIAVVAVQEEYYILSSPPE